MSGNKDVQRKQYDKHGEEYHKIQVSSAHIRRALDPYTLDVWKKLVHNKTVLDVGCGSGRVANYLAPYCRKIVGLDISKTLVSIAKRENKNKNAAFIVGDAEKLPFKAGAFDIVICYGLLHHMEKPEKVINEASRVLKKGGFFLGYEFMETQIYDELDFWRQFMPLPMKFLKKARNAAKRALIKEKDSAYLSHHPGHPGKRTAQQYERYMKDANFEFQYTDLLYPFLPLNLASMFNSRFLKFFVKTSRKLSGFSKLHGRGLEIVFQARKQ